MNLQDLKNITKIRDRGQLTIPYKIRKALTWLETNSIIEIIPKTTDRLELRPLMSRLKRRQKKAEMLKEINTLWQKIRAIGKAGRQINLSEFVIKDREKH